MSGDGNSANTRKGVHARLRDIRGLTTMTTKYFAVDASGKRHTRTTAGRTYTHCVVFHIPEYHSPNIGSWMPARDKTAWAGSLALAQKAARSHWAARDNTVTVEIIPAQVASKTEAAS
jgi:hypothetical protein